MKKIYTLLLLTVVIVNVKAQIIAIPDANFKTKLLEANPTNFIAFNTSGTAVTIDVNDDNEIQLSEALSIRDLYLTGYNIQSLAGVEFFTNLEKLVAGNNSLSTLNITPLTNLKYLSISFNQISSIDLSTLTNLEYLYINNNQLTSINFNGLTNLQSASCSNNQLTTLEVAGLSNLFSINCASNLLQSLTITNLPELDNLDCSFNQLDNLDLTATSALIHLKCNNNQIAGIEVTNQYNLSSLYCNDNNLQELDLSNCPYLQHLFCGNNSITTLDTSTTLYNFFNFNCDNNLLTSLFIKNGKNQNTISFAGNPTLDYICADDGEITLIQSKIMEYAYANCHVNSYCSFVPGGTFYTINGNSKYDYNSNGCSFSDLNYPNLKLAFSNGTDAGNLISDATGYYKYDVQAGNHTIMPILENPNYFSISPTTATVSLPSQGSPFIQNFCITPNGIHNDLEVYLLPIGSAIPGFDAVYKIVYKNKGTQTQSGTVNLAFDDVSMDLVSATPTYTNSTPNNLSWPFSGLQPFESREILFIMNINSPTETPAVNSGDILHYTINIAGAIDETPSDNTFNFNQTVVNSLDPNDKTCIEGATITPSMVGEYVHYLIRFENTGTFPAENIVVKDMIDTNKFDISTMVPLNSSHSFVTRIINTNQVEFIFENIDLPFDGDNNDGYVAFKIKTKPTLVLGNTFSNSANIYFDYNFPIVTNNYTTMIQALGNQDFEFNSVFSLSPVPTKDLLTITAKESVVMSSVNIYNMLGQLIQVNTNPSETIDVSELTSGSYFIKILSDRGSATGKFIKE